MNRLFKTLLIVNLLVIAGFAFNFLRTGNYEFIIYVVVVIAVLLLVAFSYNKVDYTADALIGLTIWAALHMAGGGISISGQRLYDLMILPISDLPLIRFDQLVHIWGFSVATLVMFCLLRKSLAENSRHSISLSIVLVMAGLGAGALNEIIEFIVTVAVPESGVGGYLNTSLDLCANLIGAVLAMTYIRIRYLKPVTESPTCATRAESEQESFSSIQKEM